MEMGERPCYAIRRTQDIDGLEPDIIPPARVVLFARNPGWRCVMTSAQGALPAFNFLFALLCGPPLLSLWTCLRQLRRVQRLGGNGRRFVAGIAVSAAALPFNFGVTFVTALAVARGEVELGPSHLAAATLAWLCFWIWIATLALRLRRTRQPSP